MSDGSPVGLSRSGPPETVLEPEPAELRDALAASASAPSELRHEAVGALVARWPRSMDAWAAYGATAGELMDAYAAYRVGYHRGLDRLRASGWRGSGYVRWSHEGNRGFLRCLAGLERLAGEIGETDEQQRCATFLRQLDPSWPPDDLDA